jgi:hypothetical protein
MIARTHQPAAVLGAIKATPWRAAAKNRPALTAPARVSLAKAWPGRRNGSVWGRTKE